MRNDVGLKNTGYASIYASPEVHIKNPVKSKNYATKAVSDS
jgi:hypothetical protein